MLDISNVYRNIKHLNLKKYDSPFPTIFISAKDPDDACNLVINQLITIILDQEPTIRMRLICKKIRRECKIDKIYILN
jgi:hypothetical protein